MTSHETYRDQLLDLAYGELGKREARALRAHLEACPECRTALERMTATRSAMSTLPAEPAPERGEAVLLAAAREAARERNRPWLPSWVWATSVGVVGVAAVALVAVRLSGVVKGPAAQHDPGALVSRSAQPVNEPAPEPEPGGAPEKKPDLAAAPAEPGLSTGATAEPAKPGEAPAPKADMARRKEGLAARDDEAAQDKLHGYFKSGVGGSSKVGDAAGPPAPAPPPMVAQAPATPSAEREFAQPPPAASAPEPSSPAAAAPEPLADARSRPAGQDGVRGATDDKDLALEEKREVAAPPVGTLGAKSRMSRNGPEDAVARYERLRAAGKLHTASRSFADCPGETSRQIETDEEGRVVKVTRHGALQGAPYDVEQYYGADGLLGAVRYRAGGSTRELRLAEAGAADGGVPPSVLQPARAGEASLDAPPRCQE